MSCGIYKILNTKNSKLYIGSSVNIDKREYKHFWMLEKNIHDNQYLQNSFNKDGKESFLFEVLEYCNEESLIDRENFYINKFKSNKSEFGYNLATVNEFRRNTYNDDVKIRLSKINQLKNNNFKKYSLINMETNEEYIFETLIDGVRYLIDNGFTSMKESYIRMGISNCLRGKKLNNGKNSKGSIRKTFYKHKFKIIN